MFLCVCSKLVDGIWRLCVKRSDTQRRESVHFFSESLATAVRPAVPEGAARCADPPRVKICFFFLGSSPTGSPVDWAGYLQDPNFEGQSAATLCSLCSQLCSAFFDNIGAPFCKSCREKLTHSKFMFQLTNLRSFVSHHPIYDSLANVFSHQIESNF